MNTDANLPSSSGKIKQTSTDWLVSGSEVGNLIRSLDWSVTPLGPRDAWPQSLRTLVNLVIASSYPMAVLWGSELLFIYNDAYKVIIFDNHPQALGRSVHEIWEFNKTIYESVMTLGETIRLEDHHSLIARNGSMEDAFFTISYSPVRTEDGQIGGALVVLIETTQRMLSEQRLKQLNETREAQIAEQKWAEEAQHASQQLLEGIINTIPVRVFWKDKDLIYMGCNAVFAHDAGFADPKNLIGKDDYQMGWRDQAELYRGDDRQVIESGCSKYLIEEPQTTPEGKTITLLTSKIPLRSSNGEINGIIGMYMDITERKRVDEERVKLEAQLRQSQKMESVGRLAGGVAHDFNNMLGVILGHTEIALEQIDPAQPLYEDLKEIQMAAKRSADLTRQLLAFARKQTAQPRILDLNQNMDSMLKMLRRLIGEEMDLVWRPGVGLWPVKVDPSQIDQILVNLVVNARDAISGVGRITIETGNSILHENYCAAHMGFVPGEYVSLTVRDNGCGMDKETLAQAFEPFFTTKGIGKGTGMGLSTVYGIVRQNSGFVNADSKPGHGTTFTIYLPRHIIST